MPDKNLQVLVCGASIAALSAAFWLARYGFKVKVVERSPHLRSTVGAMGMGLQKDAAARAHVGFALRSQ